MAYIAHDHFLELEFVVFAKLLRAVHQADHVHDSFFSLVDGLDDLGVFDQLLLVVDVLVHLLEGILPLEELLEEVVVLGDELLIL